MPEYTGNEASHWSGGLGGISHLIMQRPQMAAMARQRALQMQLNQQHGQLYSAQAGLAQQKQAQIAQQMDSLDVSNKDKADLLEAAQAAAPFLQQGDRSNPAVHKFAAIAAKVAANNKDHPAVQFLTALGLPQPNNQYAADTKAGSDKYATDSKAKTAADKLAASQKDGANRLAIEQIRASGRQGNYDQKVTHFKEVTDSEAKPAVPAKPAGTGLFGTGLFASDAVPAVPAIVAHPAYDVTTRIPHGSPSAWSNTQSLPAPAAPVQPSTGINEGSQPAAAPAPSADAAGTGQNSGVGDQRMISTSAPAQDASHGYQAGQIYPHPTLGNIKFIGGDPNDQNSWQKAD